MYSFPRSYTYIPVINVSEELWKERRANEHRGKRKKELPNLNSTAGTKSNKNTPSFPQWGTAGQMGRRTTKYVVGLLTRGLDNWVYH